MTVYIAEFFGTMVLVLLGDGVVANVVLKRTKGHGDGWVAITVGWGMAVAIAIYSVGWVSGAHINPAVSIGLASIGEFDWALVPGYVLAQVLGAFAGAVLVWLCYLGHWRETESPAEKLAVFATAPEIRHGPHNFIAEVIGTAMLLFGVLGVATTGTAIEENATARLQEVYATGIAPLLIGLLVLSVGLSLGGPTGYAINPARDLGPRLAHAVLPIAGKGPSDWRYGWIPIVAPIVGGVLGAVLWTVLPFDPNAVGG